MLSMSPCWQRVPTMSSSRGAHELRHLTCDPSTLQRGNPPRLCQCLAAPSRSISQPQPLKTSSTTTVGSPASLTQREIEELGRPLDARLGSLDLIEQRFRIEGHVFTLVAPLDVDDVLDLYSTRGQLDRDPYWVRVWPSAVALARMILQRPSLVAGKRVADLGAGLGLAGMAAARAGEVAAAPSESGLPVAPSWAPTASLSTEPPPADHLSDIPGAGAREVVLLDREPLALHCALASARLSGVSNVQPLIVPPGCAGKAADEFCGPDAERLRSHSTSSTSTCGTMAGSNGGGRDNVGQGDVTAAAGVAPAVAPLPPSYSAQVFDWYEKGHGLGFDVVLACDVLYEQYDVSPVCNVIAQRLLARAGAGGAGSGRDGRRLLLADPPSRTAANRERFVLQLGQQRPFRLATEEVAIHRCAVTQLEFEGHGVLSHQDSDVQLMAFRTVLGDDTVGLKLLGE